MVALLIDSGIGGLSIARQLWDLSDQLIYFADSKYFPYGNKSSNFIRDRMHIIIDKLIKIYDINLIILACNTAISATYDLLPEMSKEFDIPILEIIDPMAQALEKDDKHANMLVLSTERTAQNMIFQKIFRNNKYYGAIDSLPMPLLAEMIECNQQSKDYIAHALSDIKSGYGALIIGCTHYSYVYDDIKSALKKISPNDTIRIIDPAQFMRASFLRHTHLHQCSLPMESSHEYNFDNSSHYDAPEKTCKLIYCASDGNPIDLRKRLSRFLCGGISLSEINIISQL